MCLPNVTRRRRRPIGSVRETWDLPPFLDELVIAWATASVTTSASAGLRRQLTGCSGRVEQLTTR
jgi:hypothetical protein